MFRYGQFCPISKAVEVIGERWAVLVLRELLLGHTQFNQLQHALPRISPTTLTKRLAELQASGLIIRKRAPGQLGHQYQVTESARELWPVLVSLGKWGMRWARGRMRNDELDVGIGCRDEEKTLELFAADDVFKLIDRTRLLRAKPAQPMRHGARKTRQWRVIGEEPHIELLPRQDTRQRNGTMRSRQDDRAARRGSHGGRHARGVGCRHRGVIP